MFSCFKVLKFSQILVIVVFFFLKRHKKVRTRWQKTLNLFNAALVLSSCSMPICMDLYKGFADWVLEKFNFFPISTIFSHLLRGWVKCLLLQIITMAGWCYTEYKVSITTASCCYCCCHTEYKVSITTVDYCYTEYKVSITTVGCCYAECKVSITTVGCCYCCCYTESCWGSEEKHWNGATHTKHPTFQ